MYMSFCVQVTVMSDYIELTMWWSGISRLWGRQCQTPSTPTSGERSTSSLTSMAEYTPILPYWSGRRTSRRTKKTPPPLQRGSSAWWVASCRTMTADPNARSATTEQRTEVFEWIYRCASAHHFVSRCEQRKLKSRKACFGTIQATAGTWFTNAGSVSRALGLLFCWLNRIPVTAAAAAN